jgi:hypothetical protein
VRTFNLKYPEPLSLYERGKQSEEKNIAEKLFLQYNSDREKKTNKLKMELYHYIKRFS